MVNVCRVCERTFEKSREAPTFCNVLVGITALEKACVNIELELRDSFNSFCFKCRHISMSVPEGGSADAQLCYLQSQVTCFENMKSFGLVNDEV